ncbi:MAG: hypothetical protein A3C58_01325 [Candidatus Staskawiczbacteria bacterium RIFCSPHIGHO2_02_FULL_34_10]|uniref:Uncharacterized protein n=1 Tax=Candidatus Staskawiczbacteria bacterium RIFCSPHIGHO2_02_FULL_34_10 TaxID=1802205 RepID=A0A1G2HZF2_9BACT|nr:MAG: hypothetical protein A3C58_01325 [Candidatus Staskawiczbacteria bacterium RIFCSPHIGHO2_02_FULL_34_10]
MSESSKQTTQRSQLMVFKDLSKNPEKFFERVQRDGCDRIDQILVKLPENSLVEYSDELTEYLDKHKNLSKDFQAILGHDCFGTLEFRKN